MVELGRSSALVTLLLVALGALGLGAYDGAAAERPAFPADSTMTKIQKRGKLIAAGKIELPGMGYLNPLTGKYEGFGVDLAEDLAMKIFGEGGHMEWKAVDPISRIPMLQEGIADIIIETMFITPARKQQIDFLEPYWGSPTLIFVRKDNTTIKSVKDLDGKVVSAPKGSTTESAIKEGRPGWPKAKLLLIDDNAQTVLAIKIGRADATLFDEVIGLSVMKNDPSYKFLPEPIDYNYYGMGVAKGHPEYVKFLNDWQTEIKKNGRWKELYRKNLPGDVPDPPLPPYDKAFY
jgi:glutamate transport system substrate-binding protein